MIIRNKYSKTVCLALNCSKRLALASWWDIPFGHLKIRALLLILIPCNILRRLRR